MELLERNDLLEALAGHDRAGGRFVLVEGEAGVGKTSLIGAFTASLEGVRVLWGACDPLETPRPLGPLFDIAYQTRGPLLEAIGADQSRELVFRRFVEELGAEKTVVVVEDAHWADGATLDLLRFLARRIRFTGALVLVTVRPEESAAFRRLVGDIGNQPGVERITVAPLSRRAVDQLAERFARKGPDVYHATGGNPFFVTELLASGSDLPGTVREAVLARAARLSSRARALLDAASVLGPTFGVSLLEQVEPRALSALDECVAGGMLRRGGDDLSFRHELARRAIELELPEARRRALHARALAALQAVPPDGELLPRLVEHAAHAGDDQALLAFATAAADRAFALGAHDEAAAHLRRAIPLARDGELARLLYEHMRESLMLDDFAGLEWSATLALNEAERRDSPLLASAAHRELARAAWRQGRFDDARELAERSAALAEPYGSTPELARARVTRAAFAFFEGDHALAERIGAQGIEVATAVGESEALADALCYVGAVRACDGRGFELLEQSVELARAERIERVLGRVLTNAADIASQQRRFDLALPLLEECERFSETRTMPGIAASILATRAQILLQLGPWEGAVAVGERLLSIRSGNLAAEIHGLLATGLVAARRGDAPGDDGVAKALALVGDSVDLQLAIPVRLAAAESAWLAGDDGAMREHGRWVLARAGGEAAASWPRGIAAMWADATVDEETVLPEPYARLREARIGEAAAALDELGCVYDAAVILARRGDSGQAEQALERFRRLGAQAAVAQTMRRLRELGAPRIPRGPRASTARNPRGLTNRELEVLLLLGRGLPNREIAQALVLSPRTVEKHVASILDKLGTRTRAAAVREAAQLGLPGLE